MNSLRNRVQLIGNIGQDPEFKNLKKGGAMARFSIATNESYKDSKGEKVENTQWHRLVAWGKNAEFAEKYLGKGQEIAVEGSLEHSEYEKDGEKRYSTSVVVAKFLLLGKK